MQAFKITGDFQKLEVGGGTLKVKRQRCGWNEEKEIRGLGRSRKSVCKAMEQNEERCHVV